MRRMPEPFELYFQLFGCIIAMSTQLFIPTAEAAFIAGLTDRQMNRVVDERLVPERLFERQGTNRLFTRLSAAFAMFYFATEDLLIAGARRQVLEELTARVERLDVKDHVLTLRLLDAVSWKVERKALVVDMTLYLQSALARAKEVDQADALVTTDPEVMGGAAVFAGTRVPVDIVLGSLAAGIDMDRLKASYPFLTEAHIQSAKVYNEVHPRRGRPRRISEVNPGLPRRVTRVVKRVATA
ncbi:hypothetical protein GALL_176550 [mine drainage metagenome]|uniref:DUF433 domain-containing protein n=1 Tax=mine drainage metagenome TaxID=410659 RepID=A0A1J5SJA3_9ZZZZ